jgi:hypothetical protein
MKQRIGALLLIGNNTALRIITAAAELRSMPQIKSDRATNEKASAFGTSYVFSFPVIVRKKVLKALETLFGRV